MLCNPDVVDDAIRHHAVALNRPQWLNPDLLDVQRTGWFGMISQFEGWHGRLVLSDFQEAVTALSREHEGSPNLIVPTSIVECAVQIASHRAQAAASVMHDYRNGMLLYTALIDHRDRAARGEFADADAQLAAEIPRLATLLEQSGYEPAQIAPVIERAREIVAVTHRSPIPALAPVDDTEVDAEVDAAVRAWGAGPMSE